MAKASLAFAALGVALLSLASLGVARADEPMSSSAPPAGRIPTLEEAFTARAAAPALPALPDVPPAPPPPAPPAHEVVLVPLAEPPPPPAGEVVPPEAGICGVPMCLPAPCCPPPPCCDVCRAPRLDLQVHGALINGLKGPLTVPSGLPDEVFWDSLDYGIAIGGRVAYHAPLGRWTGTLGGTYWGSWDDDDTRVGRLNATPFPGGPPAPSPVFTVGFDAKSTLWGLDLDLSQDVVCTPCQRAGWGWGVRYVRFTEEPAFQFGAVGGPPTSRAEGEVNNSLLAAQLCGHVAWRAGARLELLARGAAFGGWLNRKAEITRVGGVLVAGASAEDDRFGFGGELEVEARWHLGRSWSLGVGYGLLVLFDQARGEQSIDFSRTATGTVPAALVDDTILAHRVFVGVTFEF